VHPSEGGIRTNDSSLPATLLSVIFVLEVMGQYLLIILIVDDL